MAANDDQTTPTQAAEQVTRASLNAAWQEIGMRFQKEKPETANKNCCECFWEYVCKRHPNFTDAASYLQRAEEAYAKQNYGEALNYVAQGQDASVKARLAEGWWTRLSSFLVFIVLVIYFAWALNTLIDLEYTCPQPPTDTQVAGADLTPTPTPAPTPKPIKLFWIGQSIVKDPCERESASADVRSSDAEKMSATVPQRSVSPPIFFWGFLGGVVWCMHSLSRWCSCRLFDKHFFYWYLLNPWIAAVLGGVFILTLQSGLVNANIATGNNNRVFLYLVSFVVGLATHDFLKLLIRIVTAVFGQVAETGGSKETRT